MKIKDLKKSPQIKRTMRIFHSAMILYFTVHSLT
jgi:hypothetical protein